MLIYKNKKYAADQREFIDSLFEPGGTCSGYYKDTNNHFILYDHQRKKISKVTKFNNHVAEPFQTIINNFQKIEYFSDCCGATITPDGLDFMICPDCGEHCSITSIDENGVENVID